MRRDSKTARVIMIGLVVTNLGPRAVRAAQSVRDTAATIADLAGFSAKDPAVNTLVEEEAVAKADAGDEKGDPSGGDPSGGDPSGGDPSGGDPSGGDPSGGDPSGGDPSGGDPSGGDPSGGDPSGGDPSGGDPSGGDPSGGDPSGGDPSGGDPSGGDPSGGDPSGGDPSGGDPSGGDPSGAAPDFLTAGPFTVNEGDTGVLVADIDATDGDGGLPDENVLYEIDAIAPLDPNYPEPFEIASADGQLKATPNAFIDLDIAQSYTVTVAASDSDGTTQKDYQINVAQADMPPATPQPLSPDDEVVNTRTPVFTFTAVPGVNKYTVWVNDALGETTMRPFGQDAAGCLFNPICSAQSSHKLPQGEANWWVRAENPVGDGLWSDALTFSVQVDEPPEAPDMLGPDGVVQTSTPELSWTARATATHYRVDVKYTQPGNGKKGKKAFFTQFYAASEVNCGDGSATCSLVMPVDLGSGKAFASVTASNSFGESKSSKKLRFEVDLGNGKAVADASGGPYARPAVLQTRPGEWSAWYADITADATASGVEAALWSGCGASKAEVGPETYVALWDCALPTVFAVREGDILWSRPAIGSRMAVARDAVIVMGDDAIEHLNRQDARPLAPPLRFELADRPMAIDRFGILYVADQFGVTALAPGRIAWSYETALRVVTGPMLSPQGDIFLGTAEGFAVVLDRRGNERLVKQVASGPLAGFDFGTDGASVAYDRRGARFELNLPLSESDPD